MPNARLPLPRPRTARAGVVVVLVGLLIASGCGSSDGFDEPTDPPAGDGPRVADARFDGSFEITEVVLDGTDVAVEQRPSVDIESEFGGLTVLPGCNTYFGSFTLDDDGRASFTVTGGSELDCGDLTDQEKTILAALAAADQWLATDDGFRFEGSGSAVSVRGPAG